MSFRSIVSEMARETGYTDNSSFNMSSEWNFFKNDMKHCELIRDRIGSQHYKVFKCLSTYFLISEDNEYLGSIEFNITSKYHIIVSSNSLIDRGFYAIMFTTILSNDVKEIVSDTSLSSNAIGSYDRLNKGHTSLKIQITDGVQYWGFDKMKLVSDNQLRVSIKEKSSLNELFDEYYKRIDDRCEVTGRPLSYMNEYINKLPGCDHFLFGNLNDMP